MFVAVWPDGLTLERLSGLELEPAQGLRLVEPGEWHVTLRFLGEVGADRVPDLVGALRTAAKELPDSIHCRVGPATAWPGGDRVLQIPVSGLDEVAPAVEDATRPIVPDGGGGKPRFIGHLTVARSKRRRPAASERACLGGIPFASSFEVGFFDLVVSQRSPERPRYVTVESMSLRE
jgi:2'-5' RNA ligase